jgi:mono/diheme cytochrome c family protein
MKLKPLGTKTKAALILIAIFLAIQMIPYGRQHNNPPVLKEPLWDKASTRELARRACFDCHSNQTVWPWYSMVAPASWLVYHDVVEARERLNFSEWGVGRRTGEQMEEIREEIREGDMPPLQYRVAHPKAWFSDEEVRALIDGLTTTVENSRAKISDYK